MFFRRALVTPGQRGLMSLPSLGIANPTALAQCKGWWRGDLGLTIATGVSQWNDQSGNGHNFIQGTGANQPTQGSGIGGKATLVFNGTTQQMTCADAISTILTNSAWTFSAVYRYTGASGTAGGSTANPALFRDTGSFWGFFTTTANAIAYNWDGADKSARPAESASTNYYAIAQLVGGNVQARLNQNATSSTASGNLTTLTGTMVLGGGISLFFKGELAEVAIYNRAITAAEITLLQAYYAGRYGI